MWTICFYSLVFVDVEMHCRIPFTLGFKFETKNASAHVISFRSNDTATLLHKQIYRSPACTVVVESSNVETCTHCKALINKEKNLQRSKESYAKKTQNLSLIKYSTNAFKSRLLLTVKEQNQE